MDALPWVPELSRLDQHLAALMPRVRRLETDLEVIRLLEINGRGHDAVAETNAPHHLDLLPAQAEALAS